MSKIIVGSSFLYLSILLQFIVLNSVLSRNSLHCDVWIRSNNISLCDIEERLRPDVYEKTTPEQHPYSVLVYCKSGDEYDSVCSGTLLTDYWVLSAGHCFGDGGCKHAFVYAGGNSMYEVYHEAYPEGSQVRRVGRVCGNPLFDVALARVKKKFTLTQYVNTIALPSGPLPRVVATCNFTAFGRIRMNDERSQLDYRRKTQEVSVVCPCDCYYRDWKAKQSWEKAADGSNFICSVPRDDYGVCKGDSGSGLVYKGELQGVTTSIFTEKNIEACIFEHPLTKTFACGSRDTSSVFVSVYPLVDWIDKVISSPKLRKRDCYNSANTAVSSALLGLALIIASKCLTFNY